MKVSGSFFFFFSPSLFLVEPAPRFSAAGGFSHRWRGAFRRRGLPARGGGDGKSEGEGWSRGVQTVVPVEQHKSQQQQSKSNGVLYFEQAAVICQRAQVGFMRVCFPFFLPPSALH